MIFKKYWIGLDVSRHLQVFNDQNLVLLFKKYNLEVFNIERLSTHGGSLRYYIKRISNNKFKIHIKNNRWAKDSFPNTPEGEKVFTITKERFQEALFKFPNLKDRIESFIDWDENNLVFLLMCLLDLLLID